MSRTHLSRTDEGQSGGNGQGGELLLQVGFQSYSVLNEHHQRIVLHDGRQQFCKQMLAGGL